MKSLVCRKEFLRHKIEVCQNLLPQNMVIEILHANSLLSRVLSKKSLFRVFSPRRVVQVQYLKLNKGYK
jgi:hypothetical protein